MTSVHKHLLQCPATKGLDLRVTLLGCSDWPDRWNFPFSLAGGERYPNLTSLKLEGYSFDDRELGDVKIPRLKPWSLESWGDLLSWSIDGRGAKSLKLWASTPTARRNLSNIELWLEAMDWSRLRSLDLQGGVSEHVAAVVPTHLTRLKHLTIDKAYRESVSHLIAFISSVASPLESLTLTNGWAGESDALEKILERHGPSLESLEIRHAENGETAMPTLTSEQIKLIGGKVPNLQHISINIDRNGTWPWETLEALATSSNSLYRADLWLELTSDCQRGARQYDTAWARGNGTECRGLKKYREPRLNETTATEVFEFLRAKNGDRNLKGVTFYAGDWSRPWDGPIYMPSWVEGKRIKVVCNAYINSKGNEAGDKEKPCVVDPNENHHPDGDDTGWALPEEPTRDEL